MFYLRFWPDRIPAGSPHPVHFQKGNKAWTSPWSCSGGLNELTNVLKQVRQGLPNILEMSSLIR